MPDESYNKSLKAYIFFLVEAIRRDGLPARMIKGHRGLRVREESRESD